VAESLALTAAGRMVSLYPKVRLRLTAANWTEVARAVLEREAPVGLLDLRGFQGDPGLDAEALRPQPGIFVVRPGHPLTQIPRVSLPEIMAYPFTFIGRAPREVHAPLVKAREAARAAGALHPAFPALVHESPTVALSMVSGCDVVVAVTVSLAARALRQRGRSMGEAEQGFLDLVQSVSVEGERAAQAICAELGLSSDCA
jgi:DNA-binding transcriptional LysR family regulator